MPDAAYRLSFTTGGLLRAEGVAVAELLLSAADNEAARIRAIEQNLVQQRTTASTRRVTHEVLQRLATLPSGAVELVAHGSVDDTRHLMWLAACLRYRLLRDFGREVVRERYTSGITELTNDDFNAFWNVQSSWVDALRDAADSTRVRLRQSTFQMLREAGFLDGQSRVQPVLLSPPVTAVITDSSPELLLSFPIDDGQVAALLATGNGAR